MLEMTSKAARTFANMRSDSNLPNDYGVRIFVNNEPGVPGDFQTKFVENKLDGDQVGVRDGTEYYVAPDAAGPLDQAH